jgi:hypothetical protein
MNSKSKPKGAPMSPAQLSSSSGLAYVSRIELAYAYNSINLFATAVIAALPSTHHCVVQSEEGDLAVNLFHGQVSPIEILHGARCCRECRVQIPYSSFADTCELWLHLRCSHHCNRALLGWLGSEEEGLPCRHPCSSAHVGHHLSSPGWPVFSVTPLRCRPRCRNGPQARHMQQEFEASSDMNVVMLGHLA